MDNLCVKINEIADFTFVLDNLFVKINEISDFTFVLRFFIEHI